MPITLSDIHCPYCKIKIDTGVIWFSHLWQDHQDKLEHITELTMHCLSYTLRSKKLPPLILEPEEFDDILKMGLDGDRMEEEIELRRTKFFDDNGEQILFDPTGKDPNFAKGGKFEKYAADPFNVESPESQVFEKGQNQEREKAIESLDKQSEKNKNKNLKK